MTLLRNLCKHTKGSMIYSTEMMLDNRVILEIEIDRKNFIVQPFAFLI